MIDISRAIGQKTAQNYYREKWTLDDYYTQNNQLQGYWFGGMQEYLGVSGAVLDQQFDRIMSGRRPDAKYDPGDLGKWQKSGNTFLIQDTAGNEAAKVFLTENGWRHSLNQTKGFRTHEAAQNHAMRELLGQVVYYRNEEQSRRAWDIVCRPGKTVSIAAVVGGDERIIKLHREANAAMLEYLQKLVQARGGGNNPDVTTERFLVARFEHYTSRPEEVEKESGEKSLMPTALLHTHNVMANMTMDATGKIRSIDPHEMFVFQGVAKQVYQSYMTHGLRRLGYEVEIGKNGAPEIKGYTQEYVRSESLRNGVIQRQLEDLGIEGARAAAIVAHHSRNEKLDLSPEETMAMLRANAAVHGNQSAPIIAAAMERSKTLVIEPQHSAEEVVSRAKKSLAERYAVFEHWDLVKKALEYGQGHVLAPDIEREIASRTQTMAQYERGEKAEFMLALHEREGKPGIRYTTDIQYTYETQVCEMMLAGRDTVFPIQSEATTESIAQQFAKHTGGLTPNQDQIDGIRVAIESPDRITGIVGAAGTGKTSCCETIQSFAKNSGYAVIGVAPTSRAVQELESAGIHSVTLQGFLEANSAKTIAWANAKLSGFDERVERLTDRLATTRKKLVHAELRMADLSKGPPNRTKSIKRRVAQSRQRFQWFAAQKERVEQLREYIPDIEEKIQNQHLKKAEFRDQCVAKGIPLDNQPRYIIADESSLASTRQYHQMMQLFYSRPQDRCLLVGDPAQHESVEAARVFDLMLQSGLRSAGIHQIVRQKDPSLKAVIEQCQLGKHHKAFDMLMNQGRVKVMRRAERLEELANTYISAGQHKSGIVNPDNETRREINDIVRSKLKEQGLIQQYGVSTTVLVPRQDLTAADRQMAYSFEPGNVILFRAGSVDHDIARGTYWKVHSINRDQNTVSIYRASEDGTLEQRTFDPQHIRQIELFTPEERELCVGDKIIFKRRSRELGVVNGTAAVITQIDADRTIHARLTRTERDIQWAVPEGKLSSIPHIEYGHASTSYSIQGATNDSTFVHLDTANPKAKRLITKAMGYVAFSRPRHELIVFTNDTQRVHSLLMMDSTKGMALSPEQREQYAVAGRQLSQRKAKSQEQGMEMSA